MPMLTITTNVPSSSIPNGFLEEVSKMFQQAIGKPMQYVCVLVQPQQMLMFGGTNDPCALVRVESIGKLGVEENKALSKTIFDFIKEKLGIEGTRAYIIFTDLTREIVGYKGTTFHELAKGK